MSLEREHEIAAPLGFAALFEERARALLRLEAEADAARDAEEAAAVAVGMSDPTAGLLRAARRSEDPPELATLSPACTKAVTAWPDGRLELRSRLPDGSWSAPVLLRSPAERGRAA